MEKRDEKAIENDHRSGNGAICNRPSCDDIAEGKRGRLLPHRLGFGGDSPLRICELGTMSGYDLRSSGLVRSQPVPNPRWHQQRL